MKNYEKFWKKWSNLNPKGDVNECSIDNTSNPGEVVNKFADYFNEVFQLAKSGSKVHCGSRASVDAYDVDRWLLRLEDIRAAIKRLACGKAAGDDGIMPEHIVYAVKGW